MTERFVGHFDACLGCMACVTACPSGVEYGPLIEDTRAQIERRFPRSAGERLFRKAIFMLVPYPRRMRLALAAGVLYRRIQPLLARAACSNRLPHRVRALAKLAPPVSIRGADGADPRPDAGVGRAPPDRWPADRLRAAAGLLTRQRGDRPRARGRGLRGAGATGAGLLRRAGGPRGPRRRGTRIRTAHHRGLRSRRRRARRRQRRGMRVVDEGVRPPARGRSAVGGTRAGLSPPASATSTSCSWSSARHGRRGSAINLRVAYHDACHLAHAQGVRAAAARAAAADSRRGAGAVRRAGAVLRQRGDLQPGRSPSRRGSWESGSCTTSPTSRPDVIATAQPGMHAADCVGCGGRGHAAAGGAPD